MDESNTQRKRPVPIIYNEVGEWGALRTDSVDQVLEFRRFRKIPLFNPCGFSGKSGILIRRTRDT